jgi:antitoxin ParD1/3/4
MTLHVSLPKELENLVHHEVTAGMYGSASEVVREALRRFFGTEEALSEKEALWLRENLISRKEALARGEDAWIDGSKFLSQLKTKLD